MRVYFVVIALIFVGVFTSCQKEVIKPNVSPGSCQDETEKRMPQSVSDDQSNGDGSSAPITDPNSDKDDKSRKRNGQ